MFARGKILMLSWSFYTVGEVTIKFYFIPFSKLFVIINYFLCQKNNLINYPGISFIWYTFFFFMYTYIEYQKY